MVVLNAFELAKQRAASGVGTSSATPETVAQARKRAVDAKKKPQRVVRVVDTAGRAIPFERKGECFVIEGSLSAQQTNDKRRQMRQARI